MDIHNSIDIHVGFIITSYILTVCRLFLFTELKVQNLLRENQTFYNIIMKNITYCISV